MQTDKNPDSFIYKEIDKQSPFKIVFLSGLGLGIREQREGFFRRFALTHNVSYLALDYTKFIMQYPEHQEARIKESFSKTLNILNKSQQEKLILVGACFGGLMALKAAEKIPEKIEGIIAFSPPYETSTYPMLDNTELFLQKRIDLLKRRRADIQMVNKIITFQQVVTTAFRIHARVPIQPTYQGHLSIFHGKNDNLIASENSHHVRKALKNTNCHVHIIPNTGHSLNTDFEMKRPIRILKAYLENNR